MASWWHRDVLAAGKLPLMLCFLAFVVTFVLTRTITRMIRDSRGPFRNQVTASGTHIHHAVPGIILLIIGAFTAVGGPDSLGWRSFAALAVGTGTSLVLDEFALILHLQDVYWSGEGQLSVEAVSLTAACLGLALVGFSPFGVQDVDGIELSLRLTATGILILDGVLAVICVLKVPDGIVRALPATRRRGRGFAPRAPVLDLGATSLPGQAPAARDATRRGLRSALGPSPDRLGRLRRREAVPAQPASQR